MKFVEILMLGVGFSLAVAAASPAQTAYTTKTVNLRAGPSRDYPLVARIPGGMPVEVNGCVAGWTWCDVSLWDDRGWVYAGNLEFPYQDRRVVVLYEGPLIGFPIVTFSVGPYWDTYYRGRPWYSRRQYWVHRPPPAHAIRPPRPRPPAVRPPGTRPPRPDVRPPGGRPQPQPQAPRPGGRPQVARPQPQPARPGGRPQVARPQTQPARPAPGKPPGSRSQSPRRDDHKPGGG